MKEVKDIKLEVKEKWGNTASYNEYIEKTKAYSKEKYEMLTDEMNKIFNDFSLCMKNNEMPYSTKAQMLVKKLQEFITNNYYECTNDILVNLGKMYISDERFKNNIDKYGINTAKYINEAIESFIK